MCDFENGFILCTCLPTPKTIIHNKNSRRYKKSPEFQIRGYRWTLSRFVNTFEPMMEGLYEYPAKDLGKGLTAEWVLLNLNCGNCFDFAYTPEEGDNLVMRSEVPYVYLSFIYQEGVWKEGMYDCFSTTLEKKTEGKIMPINPS